MKLVIGEFSWDIDFVSADFPIQFYKKTGFDIFKAELNVNDEPMQYYTVMLNVAYVLSGEDNLCSLEEFASKFTPNELVLAYQNIADIYTGALKTNIKSKSEKKQQ